MWLQIGFKWLGLQAYYKVVGISDDVRTCSSLFVALVGSSGRRAKADLVPVEGKGHRDIQTPTSGDNDVTAGT
jgi:hypothetical protein